MNVKEIYVIDGNDFSTLEEFFAVIGRVLIPAASWGRNLDAFNDVLRGGFGTPAGGFIIRWERSALSRERLGHGETARQLRRRLAGCHPSNRSAVLSKIAAAEQGEGSTVFDWLVEIIQVHGEGGSEADDGVELQLR